MRYWTSCKRWLSEETDTAGQIKDDKENGPARSQASPERFVLLATANATSKHRHEAFQAMKILSLIRAATFPFAEL